MLNRDSILKKTDLKTVTVDIPEWGGKVKVMELTAYRREKLETGYAKSKDMIKSLYAVYSVVDDKNDLIFKDDDAKMISEKSATAVERIFIAAEKLNKMFTSVEDDAKNS